MGPLTAEEGDRLAGVIAALCADPSVADFGEWAAAAVAAIGPLVGAAGSALLIEDGEQLRWFGDGQLIVPPPGTGGAGAVAIWCRVVATDADQDATLLSGAVVAGRVHDVVGLTATSVHDGTDGRTRRASLVCTLSPPRPARAVARTLALLRDAVGPIFAQSSRARLGAEATAATATSDAAASIAARLLDAARVTAMVCRGDGTIVHESATLAQVLAADADGSIRRTMLELAAAASASAARPVTGSGQLSTAVGKYVVRAHHVTYAAGDEALVAVTLDRASGRAEMLRRAVAALASRHGLTNREMEVAEQLAAGASNAELASALGISGFTARHHTERVLQKLGLRSRAAVPRAVMDRASGEWRVPTADDAEAGSKARRVSGERLADRASGAETRIG